MTLNKIPLKFFAACLLLAPHWVSAQSFDPRSLTPDQLEKLSASGAMSGGKTVRPQASPVSAPVRQAAASGQIPGFSTDLRPFAEGLFSGTMAPLSAATDMPVPLDYIIGPGDVVELRMFGKENKSYQLPVDRSGVVTLPDIGPLSVAGMTFELMGKSVLERIAKQKIGVEATVSMGPLRSIQIFLMGDVNNPGAYATDALSTVVNALLVGGGIRPTGSMRKVEIRRQGNVVARLDLYDAMLRGGEKANIRLQSGDTIFVPAVGKRVGVSGDVLRPAIYELLNEKTADEAIQLAGGMLPTAYAAQAKLDRVGQEGRRQVIDLPMGSPAQRKFALIDGDVLKIPSVIGRWDKSVTVAGSFDRPGAYPWKEGVQLGGLLQSYENLPLDTYRPLAIIERTDAGTGTRQFVSINLRNVLKGLQTEALQPADRVILLSQKDVEFLSSANVQYVLAGRLPPDSGRSGSVATNENLAVDKSEILSAVRSQDPFAKLDSKITVAASVECQGLIELSDIVFREGSARFGSALLNSGADGKQARLIKNSTCPAIYNQIPDLLPFVLENSVTVRGEVKQPGVLPIPKGLSLDLALAARGGLTREADSMGVEVSGQVNDPQGRAVLQRQTVKPADFSQLALEPGHQIMVRQRFSQLDSSVIRLSGEFLHPGNYEIKRGEKLSEAIARAGGVSTQAYPYGAVFLRQRVKEEKRQFYQKAAFELQNGMVMAMSRVRSGSTGGDGAGAAPLVMNLVNQIKTTDPVGRMVVEADPTVLLVRPELDVVLEAGDEIYMPRRPSSILVMGEVLNPGAVQFRAGKKADDYIQDVGGISRLADAERIYAILPNGSAEPIKLSAWNFQPKLLPPGSAIYVSREPLPTTSMDLWLIALSVFKDLALAAASLAVIGN
jgi:polysaccharide export outer membrane protein